MKTRFALVFQLSFIFLFAASAEARIGHTSGGTTLFGYICNSLTDDEMALLDRINKVRSQNNRPQLVCDSQASEASQLHSSAMCYTGQFSHVINGDNPITRLNGVNHRGFIQSSVKENISWGMGVTGGSSSVVSRWQASSGHLSNMLDRNVTQMGIAKVNCPQDGKIYWTLVLLKGNPPL